MVVFLKRVAAFKDSVVAERGWEFAAEVGIRWFHLVRTEAVQKANASRDAGEVLLINQPSDTVPLLYMPEINRGQCGRKN